MLQLCAAQLSALEPKAAKPNHPLSLPKEVHSFLCPISKSIMIDPVVLVGTGHTYESATIQQWLELKNTCPVAHTHLSSKAIVPNYALRHSIQAWAAANGVQLPPAPVLRPVLEGADSDAARVDDRLVAGSSSHITAGMQQGGPSVSAGLGSSHGPDGAVILMPADDPDNIFKPAAKP
jgi:hypothetical protein